MEQQNEPIAGGDPARSEGQESDYDGAWKETLRSHFPQVILKCFSDLHALIDWNVAPEWLDKELGQILGTKGRRNSQVDVLVRVHLLEGGPQTVFCHIEIQSTYEKDFAVRLDLYNAGLKWQLGHDVLTLAILADLDPHWLPDRHTFELAGFRTDRRFPICKLVSRLESEWREDSSLIAQVARAQIAALRTAGDPEARYGAKMQLVRNLYKQGHSSDTIREMFRLIDWMMRLSQRFEKQFKIELEAYEEELHMPYVTSIERLAIEEGMQKGLQKGREEGREEGRQEGELIGQIKILQELLELTSPTAEELGQHDIAVLSNLCQELRQRVRSRNGK